MHNLRRRKYDKVFRYLLKAFDFFIAVSALLLSIYFYKAF